MKRVSFIAIAIGLGILTSVSSAAPVELIDTTGQFKIRCEIIEIVGITIKVKKENGEIIAVPLKTLHPDSLTKIILHLSQQIPKPLPVIEPPMLDEKATLLANRQALIQMKEFCFFSVDAPENDIDRLLTLRISNEAPSSYFKLFASLKNPSSVEHLTIELHGTVRKKIVPEHIAYLNLFRETTQLTIYTMFNGGQNWDPKLFEFLNFPKVESLRLDRQWLNDTTGQHIGKQFPSLTNLSWRTPQFRDKDLGTTYHAKGIDGGIRGLSKLKDLETLFITQQLLSDEGIKALAELTSLKQLRLDLSIELTEQQKSNLKLSMPKCRISFN